MIRKLKDKLMEKLMDINCKRNYKVEKDGKCYSTKCMLNCDPEMKKRIQEDGCYIFTDFIEEEE